MSTLSPEEIAYQQSHINENNGPTVIGVSVMLTVLSAITVALRFVSRWRIKAPLQLDDWLSIPSLVS